MNPPVESIRISQQGRDQLIKLKRQTGVDNWNILCRWALCCSLRESAVPPRQNAPLEGGVEMSWKVFSGDQSDYYAALLAMRTVEDGLDKLSDGKAVCLRAHLHRGLGYLASEKNISGISGFLTWWLKREK